MGIIEKYRYNIPWLEHKMSYIVSGARLIENNIGKDYYTKIQQEVINEYLEIKKNGPLKVRSIPSNNIVWCVYDKNYKEIGEYRSELEARAAVPEGGTAIDFDLDEMFEVVDEHGTNITGMFYPTESRAWVFLYNIVKPRVWNNYIMSCVLLEIFEPKGTDKSEKE